MSRAFRAATQTSGRFFMTTTSATLKPTVEGRHTTAATSSKKAGIKRSCSRSCGVEKRQLLTDRRTPSPINKHHLQQVLLAPAENHGGELQQAHGDGALAQVVLLHLPGAEVRRLPSQLEAPFSCRQFSSGQLGQEEVKSSQKAGVPSQALEWRAEGEVAVRHLSSTSTDHLHARSTTHRSCDEV